MSNQNRTKDYLALLAAHLEVSRQELLSRWRAMVDTDPALTTGSLLSRTQFEDHIPDILDSFGHRLRAWPLDVADQMHAKEDKGTAAHGLHRWQQGFRLPELTREWGHLQLCIVGEIEDYSRTHPELEPAVVAAALTALTHLCVSGVSASADQYWQLHQDEAAGHVRDLQHALDALNSLDGARAEGWRQATHDLRGGLSLVELSSKFLTLEDVPEAERLQTTILLQKSVSLLHEMLNGLLDLARIEAGQERRKVAPFDAAHLLHDLCLTMQPAAQSRNLFLQCEGADSFVVEGDKAKVQRILQNLVLNALKYTEHGGIVVAWEARKESDADRWIVSVKDTGPGFHGDLGIPMANQITSATKSSHAVEDQAKLKGTSSNEDKHAATSASESLQHPFHQQAGEGIGLSIVKGLCDLLDATLELETRAGQGSTFRVTFPCRYHT